MTTPRLGAWTFALALAACGDPEAPPDTTPPTTPSGLELSSSSPSDLQLSWRSSTDDVGVDHYVVWEGATEVGAPTENVHRLTALPAGDRHCFRVAAVDAAGNTSPTSDEACGSTLWRTELAVDGDPYSNVGTGTFAAIAVDDADVWSIAYHDHFVFQYDAVMMVKGAPGAWDPLQLAGAGSTDVFSWTDLALDGDGAPHVTWFHESNLTWAPNDLVVRSPGGGTESVAVDGSEPSLALDADDHAHIAFYDVGALDLVYATNASGDWVITPLDQDGDVGLEPSLALDAAGAVHVAYRTAAPEGELRYATNASGAWVVTPIAAEPDAVGHVALVVDADGAAHVVYPAADAGGLRHATNRGGAWTVEPVDARGGTWTDLAIDPDGALHVAWYDDVDQDLRYATNRDGAWWSVIVDRSGDVGAYASIAVRPGGRIAIAYHSVVDLALKVAWTE